MRASRRRVKEHLLHWFDNCRERSHSPPIALACGLVFGFSFAHPFHFESKQLSKFLLQASVVGLGFGMDLHQVLHAGRSGFLYTAASISIALLLGWGLGRLMGVGQRISFLISTGTAVCGGSAIAAIAPLPTQRRKRSACRSAPFSVLNSVALLIFPAIGAYLHMTQTQFGLWSALAIHDTSSVVGRRQSSAPSLWLWAQLSTGARFVDRALVLRDRNGKREQGAHPLAVVHLVLLPRGCRQHLPTCLSAGLSDTQALGIIGLTVTLYLIGTGLSIRTLREVGVRPLLQGISLWVIVAAGSLALTIDGWIHL